jgi:signal transduction histidine kinase
VGNRDDELGRLAQTLNALIDRLQKAIEEMRRFTADAAHELRTPLAVLRSEVEIALRAPRSADQYRQALKIAADEADRLTRLADQLLFLSRQDSGMVEIAREDVRLDALLMDVCDQLAGLAREKQVSVAVSCLEPSTIVGDDVRLSRAFYNILDNAIKYSPVNGEVRLGMEATENAVRVRIEDEGPGIPAEHRAQIFKRFYRVEASRHRELGGAGLGLAIAHSAIVAHGGNISVGSGARGGALFTIELPAIHEAHAPMTAVSSRG